MDALDGIPKCVLGYQVKTRSQIVLSFMVPILFEFIVFVVVMTADVLVVGEHFRNGNTTWAWMTLCLIWIPAIACFSAVLSSPSNWPETVGCDGPTGRFVGKQLLMLLLFPVAALYRFNRRFFWCVEALFHDKASYSRVQAVHKIRETSPCELYHFLQAFLHSGPQMFLQLYLLLRDNAFRNYDTVTAQIVSIVFSFLTMASIIATYQRFESQKIVGRCYPWSSEEQVKARRRHLLRTTSTAESLLVRNSEAITPVSNPITPSIMKNFYSRYGEGTSNDQYANITDDDKLTASDTVDSQSSTVSFKQDLIENIDEIREYVRRTDDLKMTAGEQQDPVIVEAFDQSPRTPAPPTPTAYIIKRASMLKNMFVFDAQSFIKDHVPRLPEGMFEQDEKKTPDVPDGDLVPLPSRKQMISGLEEDDLVGKAISFAGWVMFLLMRMISLSVFYVFFPTFFWMVCLNHYLLMIACIIYEVRFHEKLERYFFYLFLAYIYTYSLLEFKIRFVHVRTWYVGYFVIVFAENIVMSALWYNLGVFESWWFDFLHFLIITSGILSILCLSFYYAFLRPKDKLLFVN